MHMKSLFHDVKCLFHVVECLFHVVKCLFHVVKQRLITLLRPFSKRGGSKTIGKWQKLWCGFLALSQ